MLKGRRVICCQAAYCRLPAHACAGRTAKGSIGIRQEYLLGGVGATAQNCMCNWPGWKVRSRCSMHAQAACNDSRQWGMLLDLDTRLRATFFRRRMLLLMAAARRRGAHSLLGRVVSWLCGTSAYVAQAGCAVAARASGNIPCFFTYSCASAWHASMWSVPMCMEPAGDRVAGACGRYEHREVQFPEITPYLECVSEGVCEFNVVCGL